MKASELDDELRHRIEAAVPDDGVIETLGRNRPNRVMSIRPDGLRVETERSVKMEAGPQLVPAWMIVTAWEHLRRHGRLSNQTLLNELNVKRSSFVCSLLSRFPDVEIESVRPIVLHVVSPKSADGT
jgi:hypothetical protein